MKKVLLGVLGVVVLALAGGAAFVALKKPAQRPASAEKVELTPERVERGRYLAEVALSCVHCHTEPNLTRWSGLGDEDRRGGGGLCLGREQGLPGLVCTRNITPDPETGLGTWTDGEIIRAIREGISRDGTPLFPMMPYIQYRALPDDDVRAIVAYLRSMKPVKKAIPPRELGFPLNIVVKFMPKPVEGPVPPVSKADPVAYGRWLAAVGSCKTCHTPVDEKRHAPIPGKEFAGGQEFKLGGLAVKSANLTPHETGLGGRSKAEFVAMFRAFAAPELHQAKVDPASNTVMPWLMLARMTDEDLGAIYDYLRTVPPIANAVERRKPPVAARP